MVTSITNRPSDMTKKTSIPQDWTKEYIKFRIRSLYGSMTDMAHCHGLHPTVIRRALKVPYPAIDRVIAKALKEHPATIWPSRYNRALLVSNPRLWRRWINVEDSTVSPAETVSSEA